MVMATATDQNPNQTKVPGVAGSRPAAGGNSAPEVSKFAPEWQQALAGNYKQACSTVFTFAQPYVHLLGCGLHVVDKTSSETSL